MTMKDLAAVFAAQNEEMNAKLNALAQTLQTQGVQMTIGPNGAPVPVANGPVVQPATQKPAAQKPMTAAERKIAELTAQIEALKAARKAARKTDITMKVSPKGAVQINGMGRFPTVLYASQMEWILSHAAEIKAFIAKYEKQDFHGTARDENKQEYAYVARITRKAKQ
jgi:hypothetical protein